MSLVYDVKTEEDSGFRSGGKPYVDTEGYATIGYGTKLPLTEEECAMLLEHRLNKTINNVKSTFYYLDIDDDAWEVLYNMAYQLGLGGLMKFKKMIKALRVCDYTTAASEGRDSLWYRQTPNRCERLMSRLEAPRDSAKRTV